MFVEKEARPAGESTFSTLMNKAAVLIEIRGNAKGRMIDSTGRICTVSAMRLASGGLIHDYIPEEFRLSRWLQQECPTVSGTGSICNYNNTHTQEEVVAMLRKAAVEA